MVPFCLRDKRIKDELFQNNCYWNLSGNKKFMGYPDIAKWARAKGKEQLNGKSTFVYADPMLNDTSTANIKNPSSWQDYPSLIRMTHLPLIDAGYDIRTLPGGTEVKKDIAGSKVPREKDLT